MIEIEIGVKRSGVKSERKTKNGVILGKKRSDSREKRSEIGGKAE